MIWRMTHTPLIMDGYAPDGMTAGEGLAFIANTRRELDYYRQYRPIEAHYDAKIRRICDELEQAICRDYAAN